jgi:hypothetical protein
MIEGYSTREMLQQDKDFRKHITSLRDEVKLGEIWRAFMEGRSITSEEAKLVMLDLFMESQYFETAPAGATGDMLQRREGKREVMARILFLSDLPGSVITRMRRDALDALQKMEE